MLAWTQPVLDPSKTSAMTSTYVSLVPSNLARPPVQWSKSEVKAWLKFCVEEYSLSPVCVDKFDMNGKALCLLRRKDFMERAPQAGDVLFNAFQRHLQDESSVCSQRFPVLSSPVLMTSPPPNSSDGLHQTFRPQFITILPQPPSHMTGHEVVASRTSPVGPTSASPVGPTSGNPVGPNRSNTTVPREQTLPLAQTIPAGILSPEPSEKASDSDSGLNDNRPSPNVSENDVDCEVSSCGGPRFEPGSPGEDGVCRLLWEFIYQLLQDVKYSQYVCWESEPEMTFRINNPTSLAEFWGHQKNRNNMTYEKLSRALRYYYKMEIIKKVPGKRLTYQFLQHPTKIRKGQRGARPHSSRSMLQSETDGDGDSPPPADPSLKSTGHNCNERVSPQTKLEPDYAVRLQETSKCLVEPAHSADWPDRSYIKLSQSPVDPSALSCYQHQLTSGDLDTGTGPVPKYQSHSDNQMHHTTPTPYLSSGYVAEQRNCHSSDSKPTDQDSYENKLTSLQRSASLSPSLPSAISQSEFQTEFKFRPKHRNHRFTPYTDPSLTSPTDHRTGSPPYYSHFDHLVPQAHHNSFKCRQSFQDEPEDLSVRTSHPTVPSGHTTVPSGHLTVPSGHPIAFPKNLNFSSQCEDARNITTQSGTHVVPYCFVAAKSVDNSTAKSINNCTAQSVENCKQSVEENFTTSLNDQSIRTTA
ncbi:transcription factor ETV6-like isoform X2 [Physella acuta]|uniref:transcription factor ETV6-like isoform X2 n=1 Tax=Physella acuta TaxID=109671 RepID=UPI0027DC3F91|nr:transcription factor ETV6-like isoform X2 [Physella acuta]